MFTKKLPALLGVLIITLLVAAVVIILLLRKEDARSQDLQDRHYITILGQTIPIGVTELPQDSDNTKIVQIVGVILDAYKTDDRSYLEIDTLMDGSPVAIRIDMGKQDFTVSEHQAYFVDSEDLEEHLAGSPGSRYVDLNTMVTFESVLENYKSSVGNVILVEVVVDLEFPVDNECGEVCQKRRSEFELYKANNKMLTTTNMTGAQKQLPFGFGNVTTVGFPRKISLSK